MSNMFWLHSLHQTVKALRKNNKPPRIAVVGIGHELRGDDAAGVSVAHVLKQYAGEQLLVIEGGSTPENHTGLLRQFGPDLVLLVDTADINEIPGSVRWLQWKATTGVSASTHTLPVYILATYLNSELGCEVALIGIQPEQLAIGESLSPAVKTAVDEIAEVLAAFQKRL